MTRLLALAVVLSFGTASAETNPPAPDQAPNPAVVRNIGIAEQGDAIIVRNRKGEPERKTEPPRDPARAEVICESGRVGCERDSKKGSLAAALCFSVFVAEPVCSSADLSYTGRLAIFVVADDVPMAVHFVVGHSTLAAAGDDVEFGIVECAGLGVLDLGLHGSVSPVASSGATIASVVR